MLKSYGHYSNGWNVFSQEKLWKMKCQCGTLHLSVFWKRVVLSGGMFSMFISNLKTSWIISEVGNTGRLLIQKLSQGSQFSIYAPWMLCVHKDPPPPSQKQKQTITKQTCRKAEVGEHSLLKNKNNDYFLRPHFVRGTSNAWFLILTITL